MRLLLLAPVLFGLACGGKPATSPGESTLRHVVDRGELVIGIELGFPPFEVLSNDGTIEGFDIDLARAFAKDLEVKVKFETMKRTSRSRSSSRP
jgi:polar amino acid transport system substrate-binding protein